MSKFWSFKAALCLVILFAILAIPYLGTAIIWMFAEYFYIFGFIPHLFLVGLIADIISKRIPKIFLLVPLVIYLPYYAFYIKERIAITSFEKELQEKKESFAINFDSSIHAIEYNSPIIVSSVEGVKEAITNNKIPVLYKKDSNAILGYSAYRLVSNERCEKIEKIKTKSKKERADFYTERNYWWGNKQSKLLENRKSLKQCFFSHEEKPTKKIISVTANTNQRAVVKHGLQLSETTYTAEINYQEVGSIHRFLLMKEMPIFPFFLAACFYSGSQNWECGGKLLRPRKHRQLGQYEKNALATLLNLEEYKESDFDNFTDYPENAKMIDEWLDL